MHTNKLLSKWLLVPIPLIDLYLPKSHILQILLFPEVTLVYMELEDSLLIIAHRLWSCKVSGMDFHSTSNSAKVHQLLSIFHFHTYFLLDQSVRIVWVIKFHIIILVWIFVLPIQSERQKIIAYFVELAKYGTEAPVLLIAHQANF